MSDDDLPRDAIEAAKRKSRINALVLGAVFLLLYVVPSPWNVYAPLLFLIPLVYSLVSRNRTVSGTSPASAAKPTMPESITTEVKEPFSYTPRDPKDPRRYKPIG